MTENLEKLRKGVNNRLRVDNWFTGRLGDFQQPLVDALLSDGRIDLRVLFAEGSPRAAAMAHLPVPKIQSPQIGRSPAVLARLPLRLWQTRRKLIRWYVNPPDITHVTMLSPIDIFLLSIVARSRARLLITVHDAVLHIGEESRLQDRIIAHLVAKADDIVVLSKYAETILRPRVPQGKSLHLLERGLIVNASDPSPPKEPPRLGEPLKLLFFGRIHAYKGLDLLLEAIRLVRQRGGPSIHLTIAGSGDLSPYTSAIESLGDVSVYVDGWMTDAERDSYFARCHVQVVPYIDTSVSGVVLTGIWAGMATIATPLPAFAEYLEEGVNAVFASAVSATAFADAISRLAGNQTLLTTLAAGAHKRALSMSASVVAAHWIDLYKRISAVDRE